MTEESSFNNLLSVVGYLQSQGWKVKKSAVYNHAADGKLRPRADGTYTKPAVDKYAKLWLKRLDGTRQNADDERLTRELREAELSKVKAQSQTWQERAITANKQRLQMEKSEAEGWIDLPTFEKDLAARLTLFKSDLANFAHVKTPEIVNLVAGEQGRIADLVDFMLTAFDNFLSRYAADVPFQPPSSPAFKRYLSETLNRSMEDIRQSGDEVERGNLNRDLSSEVELPEDDEE